MRPHTPSRPVQVHPLPQRPAAGGGVLGLLRGRGPTPGLWPSLGLVLLRDLEETTSPLWPQAPGPEGGTWDRRLRPRRRIFGTLWLLARRAGPSARLLAALGSSHSLAPGPAHPSHFPAGEGEQPRARPGRGRLAPTSPGWVFFRCDTHRRGLARASAVPLWEAWPSLGPLSAPLPDSCCGPGTPAGSLPGGRHRVWSTPAQRQRSVLT